ncbi:MAG: asparagine synthase (glutamine-hydrolyzing) [Labilithrix sp.]|nr:asparagine synthase (glutamine-hydrolyzing) [Labilithrix sp.]MCW5811293.1 asparagine synthase (glutamine-hydrolyzing) [Labilithrix sp.]
MRRASDGALNAVGRTDALVPRGVGRVDGDVPVEVEGATLTCASPAPLIASPFMCAICGIVHFDRRPVSASELVTMRDVMTNRGPDHGGEWISGHVALGHRRLSIIDLSPLGHQPMPNDDETVWVTFNGEIYNFATLRKELEARGCAFRSHSDTEVIAHGYAVWGEGVIARLDGMFAIGIWDTKKESLLLAVDRFGKKPLYYQREGDTLRFASDAKAIWSLPDARLTVSHAAIDCYLHHLAVTTEHTIWNEVQKVQPASFMVVTRERTRTERYWKPDFRDKIRISEAEAIERIDATLKEAVRKRMVADVPLGAFLSGGVDSSLVVAMMSELSSKPVKTFTIGFEEQDFSELEYANAVAKRYRTEHEQIRLKPDVLEVLAPLVWEYGEPFADSSAVPTYYVSKAARQFVTVALTGDGGDEQFGGYDIARASYHAMTYDRFAPRLPRRLFEDWLFEKERRGVLQKAKTLATHASPGPSRRHGYSMAFNQRQRDALYTDSFRASLGAHRPWHVYERHADDMAGLNVLDQNLYHVLMNRLPNDYLVKVDVASMKVALELRSPFLDTDLCALASALDPRLKVKGGVQKYLPKKLAERYLPWEVIYRPKKGFSLPLKHWLRKEMAPLLRRTLPNGNLVGKGWFQRAEVERLIREHTNATAEHTHRLWALLWLELWDRIFVERTMKPGDDVRALL